MSGLEPVSLPPSCRSLLTQLAVGALQVGADGRVHYANDAVLAMLGAERADVLGATFDELVPDPAFAHNLHEVLARVAEGSTWHGDLTRPGDGPVQRFASTWSAIATEDGPAIVVVLEPLGSRSADVEQLSARLGRLAEVSRELLQATQVEGVVRVMTEHLARAVGATVASVSLLVDDTTFALAGLFGGRPGLAADWATYPVDRATPAGEALLDGRPLLLAGRSEILARYPDLELQTDGERSLLCLPLAVADRPTGVVSLSFPGVREFDAAELQFIGTLCDACAQALERIQAREEARDREGKLRFLAEASVTLSSSLDYQGTLTTVAHLAIPEFADWCVIHLLRDGELRPIVVAHPDTIQESRVEDLMRRYPPDPSAPRGVYEVLRTGHSELIPDIPDELLEAAAQDEEHLAVLRGLSFRSALTVPLKIHERIFGTITWVTGEKGRRFGEADLEFGEHLARRASLAIDNAELHTEMRDMALRLQRAVLPERLPSAAGWDVGLCYLPAGRSEIGGDFYDVTLLDGGRLAAFVGDVMGRGVTAASAMAQMRSALRTLVALDPDPIAVMHGLDLLFERYDMEQLVTVAYTLADPEAGTLQVVNAGHPAPLVVRSDGGVEVVLTEESLILGVGGGRRSVTTTAFGPGDTLVMFTDGLVERRDESLEEGHQRLVNHVGLLRQEDLETALRVIVDRVRDVTRDDDVAALAVRLQPSPVAAGV